MKNTTKTNAYEELATLIRHAENSMAGTVDWAEHRLTDDTAEYRRDWALRCINDEMERVLGAITFMKVYMKKISKAQATELRDRIMNAVYDTYRPMVFARIH